MKTNIFEANQWSEAIPYIGKMGFFSNNREDFKNDPVYLDHHCICDVLDNVIETGRCDYPFYVSSPVGRFKFRYFMPVNNGNEVYRDVMK